MRKKYLKADEQMGSIQNELPFGMVNPTNSDAIKRKFLRKPYEPEFAYEKKPDTEALRNQLANVTCGRGRIGSLLAQEKSMIFHKIRLAEKIGTPAFADASVHVYGKPNKKLVKQATELLAVPAEKKAKNIPIKEVRQLLKETFNRLGFSYPIKTTQMVASAALSQSQRTLSLKAKQRFSKQFALALAVHEIATHALRAENGRTQPLTIFQRGTAHYLATEEGLAAYNEERAGVMSANRLRRYAGRVLAVHTAQQETFTGTYEALREWFDKKDAFKLTMRAKRGLQHGEDLGACTKDHVYLKGYYAIKDYVARGGRLDLLHAGKISVFEIDELQRIMKEPTYIPEPVIEWVRHKQLTED